MSRHKEHIYKMSLRITYYNGEIETIRDEAKKIRKRFCTLIEYYIRHYVEPIKIELLDNANRVFKSYQQHI